MYEKPTSALLLAGVLSAAAGFASAQDYQPRMGEPLRGLTAGELDLFQLGRTAFNTILTESQGLGPIFNDSSCGQCHSKPDIGGFNTESVSRFGIAGSPFDPLDGSGPSGLDLGGSLLQKQVIASHPEALEVIPPEATVQTFRTTPHTFGAGLVQRIPDADLLANETVPPTGVSGIAHDVNPLEGGPSRIGRFGWKAQVFSMLTFSADAGLNEMGLTNRFLGSDNAPNGDYALLAAIDPASDPEDSAALANSILGTSDTLELIDYFDAFQQMLAVPPQTPKSGMTGEGLFDSIGCAKCHVPTWTTDSDANPVFDQVTIRPYSDYLLHDMGALGDGIVQGEGDGGSFRTAPLWGISQREGLLHDGRSTGGTFAENTDDSIQEHGGEGAASRTAYNNLSSTDQDHVIAFLSSLGRPEFDVDGSNNDQNNRVDQFDWFFMRNHAVGGDLFTGPGSFHTPEDPGAICDVDQDGDFDMVDYGTMIEAWTD